MSQRILLTGANGFIGAHILSLLLNKGHSVRAVLRSKAKADQVLADFPKFGTKLDFAIVPDITSPGAFDTAVQSDPPFDTVIHTASPFLCGSCSQLLSDSLTNVSEIDKVISSNIEFLDPAIKGTVEILKSIKAHAPSVKRVVITSSCAAVVDFAAPSTSSPQKVYTEADWNPVTWEGALTGIPNTGYQASKKFAEKAGQSTPLP